MKRNELISLFKGLKLYGMAEAFDETVTKGLQRKQSIQEILGQLCRVEAADRKVRFRKYLVNSAG